MNDSTQGNDGSWTVAIRASARWTRTGIHVDAGSRYRLSARGTWWDFYVRTGPAGYDGRLFEWLGLQKRLRCRDARPFALIGAIDADAATQFPIGRGLAAPWSPPRSGELTCFANDLDGWYWNNWGSIELTVVRLGWAPSAGKP
jgi:hypothetical protein